MSTVYFYNIIINLQQVDNEFYSDFQPGVTSGEMVGNHNWGGTTGI